MDDLNIRYGNLERDGRKLTEIIENGVFNPETFTGTICETALNKDDVSAQTIEWEFCIVDGVIEATRYKQVWIDELQCSD